MAAMGSRVRTSSQAPQAGARTGQPAAWQGQQQYQRPARQQQPSPDEARPSDPMAGTAISAASLADASNRGCRLGGHTRGGMFGGAGESCRLLRWFVDGNLAG